MLQKNQHIRMEQLEIDSNKQGGNKIIMSKKIISFLLALIMVMGSVVTPVSAITNVERSNNTQDAKHQVVSEDGKTYKIYKFKDLGIKDPSKLIQTRHRVRAAGDLIPDSDLYYLQVNFGTVDLDLTKAFPEQKVYINTFDTDVTIAESEVITGEGKFKFYETEKYGELVGYEEGGQNFDNWYLKIPESFAVDIRVKYGKADDFRNENVILDLTQRVPRAYRAEWYTNSTIPQVKAEFQNRDKIRTELDLNNRKYAPNEFDTMTNENGVAYWNGTEISWVKMGNQDMDTYNIQDARSIPRFHLWVINPETNEKGPKGKFTKGGTTYYYNVPQNHLEPWIATFREELKVKFDPNGATFDQAVKAEQPIGHSMKIGETFGDLEAVTVPTKNQISNIPQKDNKDQEFVGWVTDAANKDLDFSNGQNADKLVDPNGYEVKKNVTFYAVYAPVAQGRVAVQYVDAQGNAINEKYKIKDEKYPNHAEGNKGKPVEESKIKEPKFIGYKRTADTIADAVKNKTYETEQIQTVEVKYEKLPDIIPEKKNGQDNPDVTPEVKEHYAKVTYQVAAADAEKAKLQLDNADATSPLVYYVNPLEGKTIAQVADVKAVSKDTNLYKVDANDMWKYNPDSITGTDQVISQATDIDGNVVKTEITLTAKVADTDAQKYKGQLEAQDIVKWVGDTVEWKDGVKAIDGVTFKNVEDKSSRNTNAAGKFTGKLEVTFQDDSKATVDNQNLFVRAKKADKVTPSNDDPGKYPTDKVEVTFAKGAGIQALNPENKVLAMKSGESISADDYPAVTVKPNFKTKTNKTDYYDVEPGVIREDKTITASTTAIGDGTAVVKFVDTDNKPLDPKTDVKLQIAGEPYDQTLSGKDGVKITYDKSKAPKILGYKLTEKDPVISTENFKEGQQATITLEYKKLDNIIPGTGNTKPDGYVTIKFTAQEGAELTGETIYYVNPKAGKTLNDIKEPTVASKDETKYVVKTGDELWKPVLKKTDEITENKTFEAQVTKIGEPSVTFPPVVEIEKGGSKEVTPEVKDKYGKKVDKPGKPEITETPNGITVTTPNDDGTVKIEVPKDYKGPGEITIKVKYKIGDKEVPGEINVKVKDDKKPEPKPEPQPVPEVEIPGIKIRDHYTPTYPVYVSVPDKKVADIFTHERYIFGYPDDTIRPDGDMTRAEAIAVVARLQKLDLSDKTSNIYKDTKAGMWYNAAINAAFREGYLLEKEGENIRPNDKITRAELALLISHIDKKNDKVAPFEDVKGHKFESAINQAYGNERIKGYPDGTFRPDNSITRAEVATMLNKLYDRYPDKNFIDANQNLVHNYKDMSYKGHWGYYELVEAYHTHKFARLVNNMEEWKAIIK